MLVASAVRVDLVALVVVVLAVRVVDDLLAVLAADSNKPNKIIEAHIECEPLLFYSYLLSVSLSFCYL